MKSLTLTFSFCLFLSGCRTAEYRVEKARARARILTEAAMPARPLAAGISRQEQRLRQARENLITLREQLSRLEHEFLNQNVRENAKERGYFTSDETDLVASLLFRYLACRESLWEMIAYYGTPEKHFSGEEAQTKALIISFNAAVLLSRYSSSLVAVFIDNRQMIRKINEEHRRYDIQAGTYDMLFDTVTSNENIGALRDTEALFRQELEANSSILRIIMASQPEYKELVENARYNFKLTEQNIAVILKSRSLILPQTANLIRQNLLFKQARKAQKELSDNLYVAKGILFNNVSSIRRPMAQPADFTPDQVSLIKSRLKPGDILLTFTAGYMSNVFLPGKFKHGITYVGTPNMRAAAGLKAETAEGIPGTKMTKLTADLKVGKLESGYDADVIEAVAEGVIFNSLDYLLKHHVNRLLVLRPLINTDEKNAALLTTFLMLDGQYDFNFDFSDASYNCCTEVIYRSWNRKGNIEFSLVRRAMVQTLSADDIIAYHLQAEPRVFELVLMADDAPETRVGRGRVYIGEAAEKRLQAVMREASFAIPLSNRRN